MVLMIHIQLTVLMHLNGIIYDQMGELYKVLRNVISLTYWKITTVMLEKYTSVVVRSKKITM